MDGGVTLAFALAVGFGHAFEADHLIAVSSLVSKSRSTRQLAKNGALWGLGHTSTIFLIGLLLIVFQVTTLKIYFDYFEIFVGLMLIGLGAYRLYQLVSTKSREAHGHSHDKEAYGIGLVHGLAGSGALVLLVMADLNSNWEALSYLLLFGLGSALGMSVAASIMRIPILKGKDEKQRKSLFSWISAALCIGYGLYILYRFV